MAFAFEKLLVYLKLFDYADETGTQSEQFFPG